jgi:hypothetical protein
MVRCSEARPSRGYATTEEFITHVLEKEMLHFEDAGSDDDIRDRLKGLGYIS